VIPDDSLVLLDTNVLVHAARRTVMGMQILRDFDLLTRPVTPLISYVTLAELRVLGRLWNWGKRKLQFIETVRMNLTIVPIERARILNAYVDIDAHAQANGRKLGKNDVWIAATALAAEAYLLTTDQDFLPLNSLLSLVVIDPENGEVLS
jgi:predicted nucleic acid-binding protein